MFFRNIILTTFAYKIKNMKKIIFIIFILSLLHTNSNGQIVDSTQFRTDKLSLGAGLGLDYGGLGGRIIFYPQKNIGLFASCGYALTGPGLNAGIKVRIVAENSTLVKPYFTLMFGTNGVYIDKDNPSADMFSFGPTFGLGIETRMRNSMYGYWSFGILFPDTSDAFNSYTGGRSESILISVGYHLCLFSRYSKKQSIK